MASGPFQMPAPQFGSLSRILFGTQPSVQTVSDACLRRICLLDTSELGALEVLRRLLHYIGDDRCEWRSESEQTAEMKTEWCEEAEQ